MKALYLECNKSQAVIAWVSFGMNLGLVVYCVHWLFINFYQTELAWFWFIAVFPLGLLIADFFTGVVHWATDTWFDEISSGRLVSVERLVSVVREHHLYPQHLLEYPARDYLGYICLPSVFLVGPVVALAVSMPVSYLTILTIFICAEIAFLLIFGTHAHMLGHKRTKSKIIHFLRYCHLLITPEYHRAHHSGKMNTCYCALNGWANPICDRLEVWRKLEHLIQFITGAVPRKNEKEWWVRFKQDPNFMLDPAPSLIKLRELEKQKNK